ncbi:MAG: S8 family peptidase [Candidatus Halichondribacter symbioticus]
MRFIFGAGLIVFALVGCGGRGGTPVPIRNAEFFANYGLNSIHADAVYQSRGGSAGEGITVAVIDSGLDIEHPEFPRSRISSRSINISRETNPDILERKSLGHVGGSDHGTQVAGVIAAARDGVGTQGVAYNADILVAKVADRQLIERDGERFIAEPLAIEYIARAIEYSADPEKGGAQVINISLGHDDIYKEDRDQSNSITRAMTYAASQGVAVVIAAGNEGGKRDNGPIYPAIVAGASSEVIGCNLGESTSIQLNSIFCNDGATRLTPENPDPFDGHVVAVSSVNKDDEFSRFSSTCEVADPRFCLAAPGEDIYTTRDSRFGGSDYTTTNGTSFAAPHVSGAVAVLLSTFSNLSAKDALELLLRTAKDPIPEEGKKAFEVTHTQVGNGILDLRAALNPVGAQTTRKGQVYTALDVTSMSFPRSFGLALQQGELSRIVTYDEYERGYIVDLSGRVNNQEFAFALDSLLSFEENGGSANLTFGRFNLMTQFRTSDNGDFGESENTEQISSLQFSADLDGANLSLATGGAANNTASILGFYSDNIQSFGISQTSPNPYAHLVQNGTAFHLSSGYQDWNVGYGFRRGDGVNGDALAFDIKAERGFDLGEHSGLYFGGVLSVIKEQGSFLGASGRGLFDGTEGLTQSLTLGLGFERGDVRIFGQVSNGQTRIKSDLDGALLSDFSNIRTSAALIGISKQRVFKDTDRFDIILARPLKVYSATAQLNADREGTAGFIPNGTSRIALTPNGQQTNMEVFYTNTLSKTSSLSVGVALINQPAHDANADNELATALRWIKRF